MKKTLLLLLLTVSTFLCTAAIADIVSIYWVVIPDKVIQRSNPDGSGVETLFTHSVGLTDVELDEVNGLLYASSDDSSVQGELIRSNLDGSNVSVIFSSIPAVGHIELDPLTQTLYAGMTVLGEIRTFSLDGTAPSNVLLAANGHTDLNGAGIDLTNRRLYYTNGIFPVELERIDLDGSNQAQLPFPGGVVKFSDVAVDPVNEHLYLADIIGGAIYRTDLDGGNEVLLVSGLDGPIDIELDVDSSHLYFSDHFADESSIRRVDFDGTNLVTLVSGLGQVQGIALQFQESCGEFTAEQVEEIVNTAVAACNEEANAAINELNNQIASLVDEVGLLEEEIVDVLVEKSISSKAAELVRQKVVEAIAAAQAAGGDEKKIAKAEKSLGRGDKKFDSGKFKQAVNHYRSAIKQAQRAL